MALIRSRYSFFLLNEQSLLLQIFPFYTFENETDGNICNSMLCSVRVCQKKRLNNASAVTILLLLIFFCINKHQLPQQLLERLIATNIAFASSYSILLATTIKLSEFSYLQIHYQVLGCITVRDLGFLNLCVYQQLLSILCMHISHCVG